MDRQYNLIHTVDKLDYVYSADVSPDESKLLLVSNLNKFYIVDLQTFEVKRHTVRAPYNYNIEGLGCWSFDGQYIYIAVMKRKPINSTLRRYNASDLTDYVDFMAEKYAFGCFIRLEKSNTYFLCGCNRQDYNKHYFVYFDGATSLEIPLEVDVISHNLQFDEENGIVTVASCDEFFYQVTKLGKLIRKIKHPAPIEKTHNFADIFTPLFAVNEEFEKNVHDITASFGFDRISFKDRINQVAESSCGKYLYMASASGFYVLNKDGDKVLASVSEKFGATNFTELEPGLIAVANMSTVKLYKICE